jgi:hypothetical protein
LLIALSGFVVPLLVKAASTAPVVTVEAVQMPAWVEREGGRRTPIYAGMEVRNRDQLRTGANSRLLLRTADGSSVKLGENAVFSVDDLPSRPGNVFTASMNVLEGAFRFTTDTLSRFRGKRDVRIVLPMVTTGIRGTDLWGKSAPERQVICLIEGNIEVMPQGESSIVMDRPLQFYVRDKGQSQPVASVDPNQLQQWALETDIAPGGGAARRGGRWKLTLATVDTQAEALKLYDDIRAAGYPAEILPGVAEGGRVYALRLTRLPSRAEAEALAATLKGRFGIATPRVSM